MKIIYLTRSFTPHDLRFQHALAGTGHSIHYVPFITEKWNLAQSELPPKVTLHEPLQRSASASLWAYPALARKFEHIQEIVKPDLIHAGPVHSSSLLSALTGFHPLVSMSWGSDLLWETRFPWVALMARFALTQSDAFVGDCMAVKDAAVRFGMDEDRIILFPWGVDLSHFKPESTSQIRQALGWERNFVLLSARSFDPLYGVDLVVKAFIRIAHKYKDLRLLLLGDGSQGVVLEGWLKEAGVLDRVHFAGIVNRDHLPEYYRAADLYISASHSDGSSVSLLEALASGIPALVSDIPGNCEWVQAGINGWLFRTGHLDALVLSLEKLLDEEVERLADLGAAARKVAEKRANWVENFPRLLQAYDIARAYAAEGRV